MELVSSGEDYLEYKYEDAYEIFNVTIELKPLGELYSMLEITVERVDLEEEIANPAAISQHGYDLEDFNLDEIEKEFKEALNEKPISKEVEYFYNRYVKYQRYIKAIKCYVNIPHYHYYRAEKLVFSCDYSSEALAFLRMSDVIFALMRSAI